METTINVTNLPVIRVIMDYDTETCARSGVKAKSITVHVPLGEALDSDGLAALLASEHPCFLHNNNPEVKVAETISGDATDEQLAIIARVYVRDAVAAHDRREAERAEAERLRLIEREADTARRNAEAEAHEVKRAALTEIALSKLPDVTDEMWRIYSSWSRGTSVGYLDTGKLWAELTGCTDVSASAAFSKAAEAAHSAWTDSGKAIVTELVTRCIAGRDESWQARHAAGLTPQSDADSVIKDYLFGELYDSMTTVAGQKASVDTCETATIQQWEMMSAISKQIEARSDKRAAYAVDPVMVDKDPDDEYEKIVPHVRVTCWIGNRRFRRLYLAN